MDLEIEEQKKERGKKKKRKGHESFAPLSGYEKSLYTRRELKSLISKGRLGGSVW